MLEYPSTTTYSSPDPRLTQQWRKKLKPREIQRLESRLGSLLSDRGYVASGLPSLQVGRPTVLMLRAHDRVIRSLFRLRIFGWRLRAEDLIARLLGDKAWQRRVTLRMNEIAQARAK
jgi:hypothetical protein